MEFSGFDKKCIELLESAPKKHSYQCFRSALYHLEKAELLVDIDPAMAIFRGITSEEEAASGLIYCLKELNYNNAEKLNAWNHIHKNSMIPFVHILALFHGQYFKSQNIKPALHIKDVDGERRLTIALSVILNGEPKLAYPIPPLNFGVSIDAKSPSYKVQISEYVQAQEANNIANHLKREANFRNKILYAGPGGYPVVRKVQPHFLPKKSEHIFILLKAYLLIFPYKEIQPFVQQALDAFLAMHGVLKEHDLHEEV